MAQWTFLTSHARALQLITRDPEVRLRDLADALGVTERTAYGLVVDLTEGGYVVKEKEGRRNHYVVQPNLPSLDSIGRSRTIGEVLDLRGEDGAVDGGNRSGAREHQATG